MKKRCGVFRTYIGVPNKARMLECHAHLEKDEKLHTTMSDTKSNADRNPIGAEFWLATRLRKGFKLHTKQQGIGAEIFHQFSTR